MQINMDRYRWPGQIIYVTDLIDHYFLTELSEDNPHHSLTTRMVHRDFIEKCIRPYWGKMPLECVRTMAVEHWLRRLQRNDNKPLANGTKAKIRSLFSTLFNHGIRYEWLGQGRNPVKMVRQSMKRKKAPALLEVDQIKSLLSQLKERYRLMVLLDFTTGLRRSELFGLRWGDIDFTQLVIRYSTFILSRLYWTLQNRSVSETHPTRPRCCCSLWLWKGTTQYSGGDNWIFASSRADGKHPLAPETVLKKIIRPAALRAGIQQTIGWHTFRHTYSTLLIDQGANIKVVQELMRHATSRCTLEIYSQARIGRKRIAQQRLAQSILSEETDAPIPDLDDPSEGIIV